MKQNAQQLKIILTKPYIYYFFGIAIIYLAINAYLNEFFYLIQTLGWKTFISNTFYAVFLSTNIIVALLIGANVSYFISYYKDIRTISGKGSVGIVGAFSGLLGGLCPGCVVGVFPAIMAFFGIGFSLASLPLYGLELQLIAIIILIISLYLFTKTNTCKVKKK